MRVWRIEMVRRDGVGKSIGKWRVDGDFSLGFMEKESARARMGLEFDR